jgi:hypothetical protein
LPEGPGYPLQLSRCAHALAQPIERVSASIPHAVMRLVEDAR